MPDPVRIGITTYGQDEGGRYTLPAEYVESVRRAGGLPTLLPPGQAHPEHWLPGLDGIILAGGGDLSPVLWGGEKAETNYGVDPDRDRTELTLAMAVLAARLPSLWICRGMQVLNVVFGGSLVEHLPDVKSNDVIHRAPPREPIPHNVEVEASSPLAATLGCSQCEAVSWHHQAVDQLGTGLRIVARASDGTIEALDLPDHPELEAVQWHPELSSADDPIQQNLFDALVHRARPVD